MEVVNVSGLKNNPSEALRMAQRDVVVVMNRDKPNALMVGVEASGRWTWKVCVRRWRLPCFATETCPWCVRRRWQKCRSRGLRHMFRAWVSRW